MPASLTVLGASGQIGDRLMARLGDTAVVALARRPRAVRGGPKATVHAIDLSAGLAGLPTGPEACIATTPVWLLAPVLPGLADLGVRRLVCFSTSSIRGKAGTRSAVERRAVDRVSRAEAELATGAAERDIAVTILRPALIYGTGRDRTIASAARFIRRFGIYPVAGRAEGLRQPVHADDLAAAALAALDAPGVAGRDYYLGGGETLAYRAMIARIFETLGRQPRIVRVPLLAPALAVAGAVLPGSELTGDVARRMNFDLAFDDGSAARDFGYAPRPFLSGGPADLFGPGARP